MTKEISLLLLMTLYNLHPFLSFFFLFFILSFSSRLPYSPLALFPSPFVYSLSLYFLSFLLSLLPSFPSISPFVSSLFYFFPLIYSCFPSSPSSSFSLPLLFFPFYPSSSPYYSPLMPLIFLPLPFISLVPLFFNFSSYLD